MYEGTYAISVRDFKTASDLLLDALSTFTSTELMSYKDFVKLAVLAGAISLSRPDLRLKVMDSPEVLEVIHEMPHVGKFVEALYNCQYAEFFQALGRIFDFLSPLTH